MSVDNHPDGAGDHLHIDTVATDDGRHVRLDVRGELDCLTASTVVAVMARALAGAAVATVEVDLAGVPFVSAAGWRALLECRRAADGAGVPMGLRGLQPAVARSLQAIGAPGTLRVIDAAPGRPPGGDRTEHWQEWSTRVRREAEQTRLRARDAVRRSQMIRRTDT